MDFLTLESLPDSLRRAMTQYDLAIDQRLFRSGDPAQSVFVLASGRLQLVCPTLGNKLAVLQSAGPGSLLGEEALFADRYTRSAIAKVPSHVLAYPKAAVLRALRNHADLSADLMMRLARKIQTLEANLELRDIKVSHQRVLRYLDQMSPLSSDVTHNKTVIQLDRPLQEIAREIGFTPATLSRALVRLEHAGYITRSNGGIIRFS